MTTPAPPPQQAAQPPSQQQDDGLDDAALAVAIAALLAGAAVTASYAAGVTGMLAVLKARFRLSSAAWQALGAVLKDVTEKTPPPVVGTIGPASRRVASMNAARRAQYVVAASKRVVGAVRQARAKGEPVGQAFRDALATERRYYQMHQQAMWDRAKAAGQIDLEAATHGPLLGWYAKRDKRVTAECLAADKHNFYVTPPPRIGLPGIGPHAGCRCEAGPPWPGGKLLPGSGPRYARAALWLTPPVGTPRGGNARTSLRASTPVSSTTCTTKRTRCPAAARRAAGAARGLRTGR